MMAENETQWLLDASTMLEHLAQRLDRGEPVVEEDIEKLHTHAQRLAMVWRRYAR